MFDAVEGKYKAFVFRFVNKTYKDKEWRFAMSQAEIDYELDEMKKGDLDKPMGWEVEVLPMFFFEGQLRALTASYMGSKTSIEKRNASRENGKKGGRPKKEKPISTVTKTKGRKPRGS